MARPRIAPAARRLLGPTLRVTIDQVPKLTRHLPHHRRRAHGLVIREDVPYRSLGAERLGLDVYRLADGVGASPALVYVHGGGFVTCSKRTHVSLAVAYARRGFTVFNVDYRLSPRHRYPAAFEDVAAAVLWVLERGAEHGADVSRLVLAGESAGANLVAALGVAASYRIREGWAARLYEAAPPVAAVLAASGVYQVSDIRRLFPRDRGARPSVDRQLGLVMEEAYLGSGRDRVARTTFADPVVLLESSAPDRPLAPFFVFCGTDDFLYPDSVRLAAALRSRGAGVELATYPGEPHGFHTMKWRPAARAAWADQERFLEQRLGHPIASGR